MALSAGKGTQYMVLDMSSSNLKLAVGSYNNKTGVVSVEKVGVVPLELDSINDGQISDSFGINMALNFVLEFLYDRFFVFRDSIDTNSLAKKKDARD